MSAALVAELRQLVECESPSSELAATGECAQLVAELGRRWLDSPAERVEVDGRVHLRWAFGRPRVLLLGHLDTVWPLGTLQRWPFRVDGDTATGPGVFDMKAGLVQLFAALAQRQRLDGLGVLVTSDEELGSPSSAELIQQTARGLDAVFVLEPSDAGALKVARKGVATFRLRVTGRAAHAGLAPETGVNASIEVAQQVLRVAALADPAAGTTVTPTVLSAGTATNTVPAQAELAIDVRAATVAEMRRVQDALGRLAPHLPGAHLELVVEHVRAPLERAASAELFAHAQAAASRLGLGELTGAAVGGGSDGNLTAAVGARTLDGLGAVGGNAHAEGEWVSVSAMTERTALLGALLDELLEMR